MYFTLEPYNFEMRIIFDKMPCVDLRGDASLFKPICFDSRNTCPSFLSGSSVPIIDFSSVIRFNVQACKTIEMKTLNINESIQIKK